ncbi:hypothetical protein FRB94_010857 [Tulasnella sp. JGI-2019a]|nr:hypothetical protein FRB93_009676 [Tulasnella sp. JGI-2019a]KAG8993287.1 hypothetical protein FRB94_010857 [Tulasnella sp. JGI-2019a]KAG9032062.1 hypothetical protein FRB95_001923 [Tulasnella sp. JGI-2019a]
MLESFAYNQEIDSQYEPRVYTLGGMNMRQLTLVRVGAMGDIARLCGLRTLSLDDLPLQFNVTHDEIVTAVSHLPLLETLSIIGVSTIGGHDLSLPPIALQHLHSLTLIHAAPTLLIALMTRIEAKYLKRLHVITASAHNSLPLLRLLAEKDTTIGRFLLLVHFRNSTDGILILETTDLMIIDKPREGESARSLSLLLTGIPLSDACDCLSVILPPLPLDLTVTQDTTYTLQILERTHRVTSLTIENVSGRNILNFLATRPYRSPHWRCPRLRVLRFSEGAYCGNAALLGDFITERYKYLDGAELDKEDIGRGTPVHFVVIRGRILTVSAILLLTQHKLPGIRVQVETVDQEMYIIITKIPWGPRLTMSQCWVEFEAAYKIMHTSMVKIQQALGSATSQRWVEVRTVCKAVHITMARIPRALRLTMSQCWVIVEVSAFVVSMLVFTAVIFLQR